MIPFFTPVELPDCPLSEVVDYYLYFGGKVAEVIDPEEIEEIDGEKIGCQEQEGSSDWATIALKFVLMHGPPSRVTNFMTFAIIAI